MKYIIDDDNHIISPTNPLDKINVVDLYEFLKRAFPDELEKFSIIMGDGTKQENQFFQTHSIPEKQMNAHTSNGTPQEFLINNSSPAVSNNYTQGSISNRSLDNSDMFDIPVVINDDNSITPDNINYVKSH